MEFSYSLLEFILHVDQHLVAIVNEYQSWTYLILFSIIFCETGLVIMPFLPGDSILFAMGALISKPETDLNLWLMLIILIAAAFIGDFVNYEAGKYFGIKTFKKDSKVFKATYLEKTKDFYDRHGSKTIIYARFIPIVRTFAPFVAGISRMKYSHFGKYNLVGGILWVSLFLFTGYFFGQIPIIQNNYSIVMFLIILVSLVPVVYRLIISKIAKR